MDQRGRHPTPRCEVLRSLTGIDAASALGATAQEMRDAGCTPTESTGAGSIGGAGSRFDNTRSTARASPTGSNRSSKRRWNHDTADKFAAIPDGLTPAACRATTNAAT